MKAGTYQWHKKIDRVVDRAAKRIASDFDKLKRALPEGAAPQMAFELLMEKLVMLDPWLMQLLMENEDFRETYKKLTGSGARNIPPKKERH